MRTPTIDELADREAIRDVAHRYAHGIDHLDADCMRSAYWPDAVDDHGTFVGNAWEFVDRVISSHDRWAWTMHSTSDHRIDVAGDGVLAHGELANVTHLMSADRTELSTWYGRYVDRYEKRGDEWRIIHRVCVHEGTEVRAVERSMAIDAAAFRQGAALRRAVPGEPS